MLTSIGITIEKGKVNFVVIQGRSVDDCNIIANYNLDFNPENIHLMEQFHNFFNEAIVKYKPNVIGYKIASHMSLKNSQIDYLYEPIGILRYLCEKNGIQTHSLSAAAIQNKKSDRIGKFKAKFDNSESENNFNIKGKAEAGVIAWEAFK